MSISEQIQWTNMLEQYICSIGEKAFCYSILHQTSNLYYSHRRNFIDLPVIVGSAVIGFLNAASMTLFSNIEISTMSLGLGSLIVSVLNTITTYFGWSKRAEGHRIAGIHYSKLYRFIQIEMALPREQRLRCPDMLKYIKEQYDRLLETSPDINNDVIGDFKRRYNNNEEYKHISKPSLVNGLEKIIIFSEYDTFLNLKSPKKCNSSLEIDVLSNQSSSKSND